MNDWTQLNRSREDEAAAWFARQRAGAMPAAEESAWIAWLVAHPGNQKAYESVRAAWNEVEAVRSEPAVCALRESALRESRSFFGRRAAILTAVAASLLVGVLTLPDLLQPQSRLLPGAISKIATMADFSALEPQDYRSLVGERRTVMLADGTIVTLDTDTLIRVARSNSARLVMLERGQAYFEVAKDPSHPFVVFAGNKRIMALGTAFDVRVDGDQVSVTLREGKVRVEAPRLTGEHPGSESQVEAAELTPGTRLTMANGADWHLAKADVARDLSWLHGQLVFDGDPLGKVIDEMNRYSAKKIVLADAMLSGVPVSGVFVLGEPDVLAEALAAYKLVRISGRSPTHIDLVAP